MVLESNRTKPNLETIRTDAQALGPALEGNIEALKISRAENAVCVLLNHVGEDYTREGLRDTPKRFVKALGEWFRGYAQDPGEILSTTFNEVGGYDEVVMLRRIPFESHCEHHIAPILGTATIAYLPSNRVVGISKLARLLDCYSKRLQVQERMTVQIADAIDQHLEPRGCAVIVNAKHHCMITRGIKKHDSGMVTSVMRGAFRTEASLRLEVMSMHYSEQ